mmetsp:Transcript_31501/g.86707  ORF Transcript_31501/g.86707 Transcript_31501/m.86707 type:complete len:130 (+) Transcript_31501:1024-1413(+)
MVFRLCRNGGEGRSLPPSPGSCTPAVGKAELGRKSISKPLRHSIRKVADGSRLWWPWQKSCRSPTKSLQARQPWPTDGETLRLRQLQSEFEGLDAKVLCLDPKSPRGAIIFLGWPFFSRVAIFGFGQMA